MLISFSCQNWKSFKDKATISAIAGRQRLHHERVPRIKKYGLYVLPILAIYGGNASGKSNLFQALDFAREFVVKGTKGPDDKIDVQPFLLSLENREQPSQFWFMINTFNYIYELFFSVTQHKVCEEKLTRIMSTTEEVLYYRTNDEIKISDSLKESHLEYLIKSTRANQLFLTSTVELNNNSYKDVYDWFSKAMRLIAPTSNYAEPEYITDEKHLHYQEANSLLGKLDTGVSRFASEEVKGIDWNELETSKLKVEKDSLISILSNLTGDRFLKSSDGNKEIVKHLVSFHKCEDGSEIKLDIKQESAGTRRLIELLPAFIKQKEGLMGLYIIDELDRSLHHILLRSLIEKYLNYCSANTRIQIIFTTHDLLLMDQDLFRRDEMYVIERDELGSSKIIPLNEYKGLRSDKDILKSYLQGRFGGIPKI